MGRGFEFGPGSQITYIYCSSTVPLSYIRGEGGDNGIVLHSIDKDKEKERGKGGKGEGNGNGGDQEKGANFRRGRDPCSPRGADADLRTLSEAWIPQGNDSCMPVTESVQAASQRSHSHRKDRTGP
jgi:hypothetical protein